jgi:hypothetical protein
MDQRQFERLTREERDRFLWSLLQAERARTDALLERVSRLEREVRGVSDGIDTEAYRRILRERNQTLAQARRRSANGGW